MVPRTLYRQAVLRGRRLSGRLVEPSRHDILLMLDSTWINGVWNDVQNLKTNQTIVGTVVYDMIPITHPQFCGDDIASVFPAWLQNALRCSDFFMTISKTVRDELKSFAISENACVAARDGAFGYFHLGCDLDQQSNVSHPSVDVRAAFAGPAPYLMVGTIEPRKNHRFVLDAFELLWRDCPEARLCIVGNAGWKCADIIRRIRSHERYGKQLFMLHGLGDSELEYCYRNAKALVYSSVVEGFGLPLIEALQRGLRVMASDTPIHREVAQRCCAYFNLDDRPGLARLIRDLELQDRFPSVTTPDSISTQNWRASCLDLLSKVLDAGSHRGTARLSSATGISRRAA